MIKINKITTCSPLPNQWIITCQWTPHLFDLQKYRYYIKKNATMHQQDIKMDHEKWF